MDENSTTTTLKLDAWYGSEYSRTDREVGKPAAFKFWIDFETIGEARELANSFPKSCKMTAVPLLTSYNMPRGVLSSQAVLRHDDVNRGVNETGLRRYRSIIRTAAALGIDVVFSPCFSNSYTTREEFESAIGL